MKTFALAALLGSASAVQISNQEKLYVEMNKIVETVQDW